MRSRRVRKVSSVLAEFAGEDGIIPREAFFDTSPSKAHPQEEGSTDDELADLLQREAASCSSCSRDGLPDDGVERVEGDADAKSRQRKKYTLLICMSCDVRFRDDISQARSSELVLCTDCLQAQMRTKLWKDVSKAPRRKLDSNNHELGSHHMSSQPVVMMQKPKPVATTAARKRTRGKRPTSKTSASAEDYSVYIPVMPINLKDWQLPNIISVASSLRVLSSPQQTKRNCDRQPRKPNKPARLSSLLDR